jgi:hypothetical protein
MRLGLRPAAMRLACHSWTASGSIDAKGAPPGVFTETFADSDQLYLRVVARYDIKPLNAAGVYIITTASWPSRRAPRRPRTAEGLRRVGVVLYDVDPDQVACRLWPAVAGDQPARPLVAVPNCCDT